MKKTLNIFLIISMIFSALTVMPAYAQENEIEWHQYNGYSTQYEFSVKYPADWKARTYGDDMQGFAPADINDDSYFIIQEFEGQTYDQVLQFYMDDSTQLVETEDIIVSSGSDLIGKKAIFKDVATSKNYQRTLIKRGSLIVVLSGNNLDGVEDFPTPSKYQEEINFIYNSFRFSNDWHQYIDLNDNYTFIFPSDLELTNLSDGVTISDPSKIDKVVFSVFKYPGITLKNAPDEAEGYSEDLLNIENTLFHGIENAIASTYKNKEANKTFRSIFVENNSTSYEISDINIESNFPRLDYYNEYVAEMVASFEFFNIDESKKIFQTFPDVTDSHVNQKAINYLANKAIIAGYPDGTFKPDSEINRAELTKMIVAAVADPDADTYKNCFPDVKIDWYAPYVCYAKEKNWVQGYSDGTFKPEQKINRVEAMKIVLEVLFKGIKEEGLKETEITDINLDDWYGKYFIFAENRNLLDKRHVTENDAGYSYMPEQNITRKEVAEMMYRSVIKLSLRNL